MVDGPGSRPRPFWCLQLASYSARESWRGGASVHRNWRRVQLLVRTVTSGQGKKDFAQLLRYVFGLTESASRVPEWVIF